MDDLGRILVAVITPFGIALTMWTLGRIGCFRWRPTTDRTLASLNEEYAKWEQPAVVPFLLGAALLTFLFQQLLVALADIRFGWLPESRFLLAPAKILWLLPALFLGMLGAAPCVILLYRRLLGGHRYREYLDFVNRKGYRPFKPNRREACVDSVKALRAMAWVLVPICLVAVTLFMNCYTRVDERAVVVNPLIGFQEKAYSWPEVERVELVNSRRAPAGNVVRRPSYRVTFADGHSHDFHSAPDCSPLARQREVADYVCERSGLKIETVDPFP